MEIMIMDDGIFQILPLDAQIVDGDFWVDPEFATVGARETSRVGVRRKRYLSKTVGEVLADYPAGGWRIVRPIVKPDVDAIRAIRKALERLQP